MINNHEDWIQEYRKDKTKVWIRLQLSSGSELYFKDFEQWYKFVENYDVMLSKGITITKVKLQYRSNVVECEAGSSGLYLIRSIIGRMGGKSTDTITIGKINGSEVERIVYSLPELIEKESSVGNLENCFKEAYVKWE